MSFNEFYKDLAADEHNMSFWLPKIQNCGIKIPKTAIVSVPPEIMELFFLEKEGMTLVEMQERIYQWVKDEFIPKAKAEIGEGIWFLKNGAFSDKFNFNYCINFPSSPMRMADHILSMNYDSLMFDTGGNTEMVAREFIDDPSVPTIYKGMPLRTEFRVFYDFDNHNAIYVCNYWDWDYCHQGIARDPTDKIVYEVYYPIILSDYNTNKGYAVELVNHCFANINDLHGIWSVDLMKHGNEMYLIDMAHGANSAYWDKEYVNFYFTTIQNGNEWTISNARRE